MAKNSKPAASAAAAASKVEAASTVPTMAQPTETADAAVSASCCDYAPDHFVKINESDWHNVAALQIGETYLRRDGSHYVTIVEVFNGTCGLAHGHYHVLVDGCELEPTNERAVYNGVVTIWSPALKQYLTCEASELKQQAVKYKDPNTSTGGGRSLFDLSKVMPGNYLERGQKALDNATAKVSTAIAAVKVLTAAVPGSFELAVLEALQTALADSDNYLQQLAKVAENNEREKAAKVAAKVATAVSELSIEAQIAALQAQLAKLQSKGDAAATA